MIKKSSQFFNFLFIIYLLFFIIGILHTCYNFAVGMPDFNYGEQYRLLRKNNFFKIGYFLDIYLFLFKMGIFVKIFGLITLFFKNYEFFKGKLMKLKDLFFIYGFYNCNDEMIVFSCIYSICTSTIIFIKGDINFLPGIGFPLSFFVIISFNFFFIQFSLFLLKHFQAEKFYLLIIGFFELLKIFCNLFFILSKDDAYAMHRVEKNLVSDVNYSNSIFNFISTNGINKNVFNTNLNYNYGISYDITLYGYSIIVSEKNISSNLILNLVIFIFLKFKENFYLKIYSFNFLIEIVFNVTLIAYFYYKILKSKSTEEMFFLYGLYSIYDLTLFLIKRSMKCIFAYLLERNILRKIFELNLNKDLAYGIATFLNNKGGRVDYWSSPIFIIFGKKLTYFQKLRMLNK